ncbi:50S ribosomal protein L2 [Candidatus Woesearchaeota archaeon]|nr:50S ribosomal protein L2 [Candidatus Woesearchaeota archaeon]
MGKNLIQQRRGKGTIRFRAPSFRYIGEVKHRNFTEAEKGAKVAGTVVSVEHSSGHYAPIARVRYDDSQEALVIAPEGIRVGDMLEAGFAAGIASGNTLPLLQVPEGTLVYNIESSPGDGGKFVRSTGLSAKVIAKSDKEVVVLLPSKKTKAFNPWCRVTIGVVAGAGRTEKPLLKAGNNMFKKMARNKFWPQVKGQAMNAVAHPHGGSRSSKKNKPTIAKRFASSGAKVGHLRPKRTGRTKL